MTMQVHLRMFAALALVLGLAGCASDGPSYAGQDAGFLVASIGAQPEVNFPNYKFRFRSRDHKYEGSIRLPGNFESLVGSNGDFEASTKWGVVTVARLAPGDYEIFNYNIGMNGVGFFAGKDFSIPFVIKPGEATYVGEYIALTAVERTLGVMQPMPPFGFLLSDEQERDLHVARARVPEIAKAPVTKAVPDPRLVKAPGLTWGPNAPNVTTSQTGGR
jgi:hypothetical protein